jgi:DNA-binding PadR family transcriptional regulator
MNTTYGGGRPGPHRQDHGDGSDRSGFGRSGFGHSGFGLWDTIEDLRAGFERRVGPRMGRGDVRAAILALLVEEPMHGYQIIHEIEKRSGGGWKPSAGSVYPTLQLLADEGFVQAQEADGKKTYSLTDSGKEEAKTSRPAPWESPSVRDAARSTILPKAGAKLAQAAVQIARGGNTEQVEEAVAVMDEARRKLYAILAKE